MSEPSRFDRCRRCGYDLRGTDADRCPECGCDDPARWTLTREEMRRDRVLFVVGLVTFLAMVLIVLAVMILPVLLSIRRT